MCMLCDTSFPITVLSPSVPFTRTLRSLSNHLFAIRSECTRKGSYAREVCGKLLLVLFNVLVLTVVVVNKKLFLATCKNVEEEKDFFQILQRNRNLLDGCCILKNVGFRRNAVCYFSLHAIFTATALWYNDICFTGCYSPAMFGSIYTATLIVPQYARNPFIAI